VTASEFSENESVAPRGQNVTPKGRPHAGPVIVGFDADSDTPPTIEAAQVGEFLRAAERGSGTVYPVRRRAPDRRSQLAYSQAARLWRTRSSSKKWVCATAFAVGITTGFCTM
jgi:hypothetical protein